MNRRFLNAHTDEHGFTIIEVMVAMLILTIGVLGTVVMIDTANGLTSNNKGREGALSLSREIAEVARQTDYDSLSASGAAAALQTNAGLADASGTAGWQVIRRGINYTVGVDACIYDEPKDGGRATTDTRTFCAGSASSFNPATTTNCVGRPTPPYACIDQNPDDFRRLRISSSWFLNGSTQSSTQTALIVNPTGGIGPRITNVTRTPVLVNNTFGPTTAGTSVTYTVTTGTTASSVNWSASDGSSKGTATAAGANTWQFTWDLGSPAATGSVHDGNYTVEIQAFSAAGIAGDLNVQTLVVNRVAPQEVTGFAGGRNNRNGEIVDFEWIRNTETDIVGYRVYRVAGAADWTGPAAGDPADVLVCGTVAQPLNGSDCFDPNPDPTGELTYYVKAVDRDTSGNLRESAGSVDAELTTLAAASPAPTWPAGTALTGSAPGGVPTLTWNLAAEPGPGRTIQFYRVYRDPASANPTYAERYDTNGGTDLGYEDDNFGTTNVHTYTVTAVDDTYQESAPLAPFATTP